MYVTLVSPELGPDSDGVKIDSLQAMTIGNSDDQVDWVVEFPAQRVLARTNQVPGSP